MHALSKKISVEKQCRNRNDEQSYSADWEWEDRTLAFIYTCIIHYNSVWWKLLYKNHQNRAYFQHAFNFNFNQLTWYASEFTAIGRTTCTILNLFWEFGQPASRGNQKCPSIWNANCFMAVPQCSRIVMSGTAHKHTHTRATIKQVNIDVLGNGSLNVAPYLLWHVSSLSAPIFFSVAEHSKFFPPLISVTHSSRFCEVMALTHIRRSISTTKSRRTKVAAAQSQGIYETTIYRLQHGARRMKHIEHDEFSSWPRNRNAPHFSAVA